MHLKAKVVKALHYLAALCMYAHCASSKAVQELTCCADHAPP